jgi:superfamily II DNA or RNA helicase
LLSCAFAPNHDVQAEARIRDPQLFERLPLEQLPILAEYGQLIVDECHHLSAFTFEQVLKQVKAK